MVLSVTIQGVSISENWSNPVHSSAARKKTDYQSTLPKELPSSIKAQGEFSYTKNGTNQ